MSRRNSRSMGGLELARGSRPPFASAVNSMSPAHLRFCWNAAAELAISSPEHHGLVEPAGASVQQAGEHVERRYWSRCRKGTVW